MLHHYARHLGTATLVVLIALTLLALWLR